MGSRVQQVRSARPGGRVWVFRGIAVLLPFVLLFLVEVVLRMCGVGHDTRLFIRDPNDSAGRYWVMNEYASARYFGDAANATKGSIEPFAVHKAPGTFRIFVLGESTTAGYPYFHNGSFDRWLEFRLMHEHPDMRFEVVNVALTAVNSYTVLDFGQQVVDYQPDAVLVYVGHNEYYGAMGVGSTSRGGGRWLAETMMLLRRLRLVQWVSSLRRRPADTRENLMQRMAADQEIALGSGAYRAGIEQFRSNMDAFCTVMQAHGVPVFLSTVVSNERDCRPFVGGDAVFAAADGAYARGEYGLAKRLYDSARDVDELRFRAPSAINTTIRDLAGRFSGVHLVETERLFDSCSPHGIVDSTTILEHVHPNLFGYALMSEAFYRALSGMLPAPVRAMSFGELLAKMPVTAVDSLNGAYTIMMLKSRWPWNAVIPASFKRGGSIPEQLAGGLAVGRIGWGDAMNELYTLSMRGKDYGSALRAVGALALDRPGTSRYALYAGRLCFEAGDSSEAIFYFRHAYAVDSSLANLQSLYLLYMKLDRPEEAMGYLEMAMGKEGSAGSLAGLKTLTELIIKMKGELAGRPGDKQLLHDIAMDYHEAGADEAARKYVR